jgi:hypothetical protein
MIGCRFWRGWSTKRHRLGIAGMIGSIGVAAARTRAMGAPTNPPAPVTMMLTPDGLRSMPGAYPTRISFNEVRFIERDPGFWLIALS